MCMNKLLCIVLQQHRLHWLNLSESFNHLLLGVSVHGCFWDYLISPKWVPGQIFPPLSLISLDGVLNFGLVIAAAAAAAVFLLSHSDLISSLLAQSLSNISKKVFLRQRHRCAQWHVCVLTKFLTREWHFDSFLHEWILDLTALNINNYIPKTAIIWIRKKQTTTFTFNLTLFWENAHDRGALYNEIYSKGAEFGRVPTKF